MDSLVRGVGVVQQDFSERCRGTWVTNWSPTTKVCSGGAERLGMSSWGGGSGIDEALLRSERYSIRPTPKDCCR